MTIHQMFALHADHVDLDTLDVRIEVQWVEEDSGEKYEAPPKHGSIRTVTVAEFLVEDLADLIEHRRKVSGEANPLLFCGPGGQPDSRRNHNRRFRRAARRAGWEDHLVCYGSRQVLPPPSSKYTGTVKVHRNLRLMEGVMRISVVLSVVVLVLAGMGFTTSAQEAEAFVDAAYTLQVGESATYEGEMVPGGINTLYYSDPAVGVVGGHGTCTKDPDSYCDHLLVELVNPVPDDGDETTDLTAKRFFFTNLTTEAADYDLIVYASDADATIGEQIASSAFYPGPDDFTESTTVAITTRESQPSAYVLVRIIYYAPTTPATVALTF